MWITNIIKTTVNNLHFKTKAVFLSGTLDKRACSSSCSGVFEWLSKVTASPLEVSVVHMELLLHMRAPMVDLVWSCLCITCKKTFFSKEVPKINDCVSLWEIPLNCHVKGCGKLLFQGATSCLWGKKAQNIFPTPTILSFFLESQELDCNLACNEFDARSPRVFLFAAVAPRSPKRHLIVWRCCLWL